MASSKLVTTNPDLPRQSSICYLSSIISDHNDPSKTLGSMSMDDLLKSIYSSSEPNQTAHDQNFHAGGGGGAASISHLGNLPLPKEMGAKTVDEVWKEIVAGGSTPRRAGAGEGGVPMEAMTLEDYLTKAGAVREEDVRTVANVVAAPASYHMGTAVVNGGGQFQMEGSSVEVFGNGAVVGVAAASGGGGGRGKRRAVEEPLDKATLQKQKRMIKNRESAARSRERKQAYTVELETMVTHLEAENARLLREEAEINKQRFKQLMECLIPVVEKRKPRRMLRRTNSVQW